MTFSNGATVGFVTTDDHFANHPASSRKLAHFLACINVPESPWVNIVYEVTTSGKSTYSMLLYALSV